MQLELLDGTLGCGRQVKESYACFMSGCVVFGYDVFGCAVFSWDVFWCGVFCCVICGCGSFDCTIFGRNVFG